MELSIPQIVVAVLLKDLSHTRRTSGQGVCPCVVLAGNLALGFTPRIQRATCQSPSIHYTKVDSLINVVGTEFFDQSANRFVWPLTVHSRRRSGQHLSNSGVT